MVKKMYKGFEIDRTTGDIILLGEQEYDSRKIIDFYSPLPDNRGYTDGYEYWFTSENFMNKYLRAFNHFYGKQYHKDGTAFTIELTGSKKAYIMESYNDDLSEKVVRHLENLPYTTDIRLKVYNVQYAYEILRGLKELDFKIISTIQCDDGDPTKEDRDNEKKYTLDCVKCGKEFRATRADKKYCTKECYDKGRKR